MSSMSIQPIAGVSSTTEAVVSAQYPSICAGGVGRFLGRLFESIPIRIPFLNIKLSYILFCLPIAPLSPVLYAASKLFGNRYVLTNRSVQVWTILTNRMVESLPIDGFDHLDIEQLPGQEFYNAADICLRAADGKTLLRLPGVLDAGAFANTIRRMAESRMQVQTAEKAIASRAV